MGRGDCLPACPRRRVTLIFFPYYKVSFRRLSGSALELLYQHLRTEHKVAPAGHRFLKSLNLDFLTYTVMLCMDSKISILERHYLTNCVLMLRTREGLKTMKVSEQIYTKANYNLLEFGFRLRPTIVYHKEVRQSIFSLYPGLFNHLSPGSKAWIRPLFQLRSQPTFSLELFTTNKE